MSSYYDVIIIGSGMSGLYAALSVKKLCPELSYLVIERDELFGGRSYDVRFEKTDVVTGAGIGRKNKDKLLLQLMKDFKIPIKEFETQHKYASSIYPQCEVKTTFLHLQKIYENENKNKVIKNHETFKEYATTILGEESYNQFILCAGYSDYENEDIYDTLYNYGFEDNYSDWTSLHIPWKLLIYTLAERVGNKNIHVSNKAESIEYNKNTNEFVINVNQGSSQKDNQ